MSLQVWLGRRGGRWPLPERGAQKEAPVWGEDDGEFEVAVAPPGGAGGDAAGPACLELQGPKLETAEGGGGWGRAGCLQHRHGSEALGVAGTRRAYRSRRERGQAWGPLPGVEEDRAGDCRAEVRSREDGGSGKDPGRGAGDCGQSGG